MCCLTLKLSSGDDIPDSKDLYPNMYVYSTQWYYVMGLTKKVIQSVSTEKHRCNKFPKQSCFERSFYKNILKEYGCELLFLKDGTHLAEFKPDQGY
jgi:hypothetical protein